MLHPVDYRTASDLLTEAMPTAVRGDSNAPSEQDIQEGYKLFDEAVEAFNNADPERMAAINHYPHIRITGPVVVIWNTPEEYIRSNPRDKLLAKDSQTKFKGWKTSKWEWCKLIQASSETMHFAVAFSRLDESGSRIATFESLRILTKKNGRWGQQVRSSFAGIADGGAY